MWVVGSEVEGEVGLTWCVDEVDGKSANGMSGLPKFSTLHLHMVVFRRGTRVLERGVFLKGLGVGVIPFAALIMNLSILRGLVMGILYSLR